VVVTPAVVAVPAVTHIVHHDAVVHYVWVYRNHNWNKDMIVDVPAYDEVVIDVPAVPEVPAVYQEQCVADTSYVPPVITPEITPEPVVNPPVASTEVLKTSGKSSQGGHRRCYVDMEIRQVICPVGGLTWTQVLKYVLKMQ
jgi:hypothetical protein